MHASRGVHCSLGYPLRGSCHEVTEGVFCRALHTPLPSRYARHPPLKGWARRNPLQCRGSVSCPPPTCWGRGRGGAHSFTPSIGGGLRGWATLGAPFRGAVALARLRGFRNPFPRFAGTFPFRDSKGKQKTIPNHVMLSEVETCPFKMRTPFGYAQGDVIRKAGQGDVIGNGAGQNDKTGTYVLFTCLFPFACDIIKTTEKKCL